MGNKKRHVRHPRRSHMERLVKYWRIRLISLLRGHRDRRGLGISTGFGIGGGGGVLSRTLVEACWVHARAWVIKRFAASASMSPSLVPSKAEYGRCFGGVIGEDGGPAVGTPGRGDVPAGTAGFAVCQRKCLE